MNQESPSYHRVQDAVAHFDSEDSAVFLSALESDNDHIVWEGIKGCGLKKLREAVPHLVAVLGRPCRDLVGTDHRRIAAWSLGLIGFEGLEPFLDEGLNSQNVLLREGLADALGMTREQRAIPYLQRLVADSDRNVALWAALSLSKTGEAAIPSIEAEIKSAKERWRAAYLLDALLKIDTPRSLKRLDAYLASEEFCDLREVLEHLRLGPPE